MATRSTIAVKMADGSVRQVYAHWDGYLDHNGRILQKHYNTQERAEALVALGDISSLRENIEPSEGLHDFDNPQPDVNVYYGRDRGEEDVHNRKYWNVDMYRLEGQQEEYDYLFADGEWTVRYYQTGKFWVPLKPLLTKLNAIDVEATEKVKDALRDGEVVISFTKTDGTLRTMRCTLSEGKIPSEHAPKGTRAPSGDAQPVFDLDAKGWRSFRWDSLISAEAA
jgi:hypothetical protein